MHTLLHDGLRQQSGCDLSTVVPGAVPSICGKVARALRAGFDEPTAGEPTNGYNVEASSQTPGVPVALPNNGPHLHSTFP